MPTLNQPSQKASLEMANHLLTRHYNNMAVREHSTLTVMRDLSAAITRSDSKANKYLLENQGKINYNYLMNVRNHDSARVLVHCLAPEVEPEFVRNMLLDVRSAPSYGVCVWQVVAHQEGFIFIVYINCMVTSYGRRVKRMKKMNAHQGHNGGRR